MHATLAQPAGGADADALKDLRAQRALKIPCDFLKTSGWIFGPEQQNSQDFLHACNARSLSQDPVPTPECGGRSIEVRLSENEDLQA